MSSHISISCNDVSKLIQEFENSNGSSIRSIIDPILKNITDAKKGTQILVQLLVHITKPVTLDKFIVVPLTKTS